MGYVERIARRLAPGEAVDEGQYGANKLLFFIHEQLGALSTIALLLLLILVTLIYIAVQLS